MYQTLFSFPGINQIVEGNISFATGITPSSAAIVIAPQANLTAQVGTLSVFDGQNEIDWYNCRIDTNSFERNSSGLIWKLMIYDRRWMWQSTGGGGVASRGINLRADNDEFIPVTKMSLQQAASFLLDAMNETDYDVSALPTDQYPELMWDASLPAQVLEEMCEQFGYRVVLGLDNNVRICQVGVGADLPITPDVMTNSMSMKIPAMPDYVAVVCAPDWFQVDLALEAVGIENDTYGTLKPIGDLSYMPQPGWAGPQDPGGWQSESDLSTFQNVWNQVYAAKGPGPADLAQQLAMKSVFKYYRVVFPIPIVYGYTDSQGNPNAGINYPWQVKLLTHQCVNVEDYLPPGLDPAQLPSCYLKPAAIGGVYFDEHDGLRGTWDVANSNNVPQQAAGLVVPYGTYDPLGSYPNESPPWNGEIQDRSWQFKSEGGSGFSREHVVVFNRPIYMNTNYNNVVVPPATVPLLICAPAVLILRTAITILDQFRFSPVRSYFRQSTGSNLGTPTRSEVFSDLQMRWFYNYSMSNNPWSNSTYVQPEAQYYMNGIMAEYAATQPQTITYAGLKAIPLDGAIQHIHIVTGKHGCTTTVARNNELLQHIQSISYRKEMAKVSAMLRGSGKNKNTLRTHRARNR